MLECVLVKVAGESVAGLRRELHRRAPVDGEGVRLKLADGRDPDEAVLSWLGPQRRLLQDDLGASVGKGVKCCLVVGAVVQHPEGPDETIQAPHGAGENGDDQGVVRKLGLMEANCDDEHDPRGDVRDVEHLVRDAPEKHGREDDAENGKACHDGGNVLLLGVYARQTPLAVEEGRVSGGVDNHRSEHGVAGDVVKAVESLVRVGCQEGQRSVLQRQEYDQRHVSQCEPV